MLLSDMTTENKKTTQGCVWLSLIIGAVIYASVGSQLSPGCLLQPSLWHSDDRSRNSAAPLRRILPDSWRNTSAFPIPLHNRAVAHMVGCGPARECDLPIQTWQDTLPHRYCFYIWSHVTKFRKWNAIHMEYTVKPVKVLNRNWDMRVEDTGWLYIIYILNFCKD